MWFLKSNLNIGQVMPPALEALRAQETGHVARGLKGAHGGAISFSAAFCAVFSQNFETCFTKCFLPGLF